MIWVSTTYAALQQQQQLHFCCVATSTSVNVSVIIRTDLEEYFFDAQLVLSQIKDSKKRFHLSITFRLKEVFM